MKFLIFLALLCTLASAGYQARRRPSGHHIGGSRPPPYFGGRFRRDTKGSIVIQDKQSLSGPDGHPSQDINNQRPLGVEHRFKNDIYVRGQGQVQLGPRAWRFRRLAIPGEEEAEAVREVYRPNSLQTISR